MDFVELFNDSFERTVAIDQDAFFAQFYKNFTNKSKEISDAFKTTDMQRQISMLEHSLLMMVDFASHRSTSEYLERLAQFHLEKQISDNTYDLWFDALIETLVQVDAEFTQDDALAWRIMLSPGIEYMKNFKT